MQSIKVGKALGANIRRKRKAQRLTQDQLSARLQVLDCDLSRSTVAKIEVGIRHLSAKELQSIKTVLDMSYEEFFENLDI
ncbi:MAG: helix-turn-helix domain-containing protein [Oscillospiraceae bacterium]|jgi:transcriptional regulator with XRE-family HTH domain|nr:helix-turn-helix domain-containing protein [Oscillospiraceae bacterium]